MPMTASEIERTILAAIPDAQITIQDLAGDGGSLRLHRGQHGIRRAFSCTPAQTGL